MLKKLRAALWKNFKRIGKEQGRQASKLTAILSTPSPVKKKKLSKTVVSPKSLGHPPKQNHTAQPQKKRALQKSPLLPGKYLLSYFTQKPGSRKSLPHRLTYYLYIPSPGSVENLALVVMLHGCGQTATQFADGTRMNQLAEEKGFAVLYPQQSLHGQAQHCWRWWDRSSQSGAGEAQHLHDLINHVIQQHAFNPARIYLAGLSAGAGMAHVLALSAPKKFAAIALHSGPVFGAAHSALSAYEVMQHGARRNPADIVNQYFTEAGMQDITLPAILLQGMADKTVRSVNQGQLTQQFVTQGILGKAATVSTKTWEAKSKEYHPCHAYQLKDYRAGRKLLLRICSIDSLEHAWSGGDCRYAFNDCTGPDASKLIWDFFKRHIKQK